VFICRRFSLSGSNAPAGGWQVFICRRFSLSGSSAPAGGWRTVVCCRLFLAPRWRLVFVDGLFIFGIFLSFCAQVFWCNPERVA
jgi:hypothetical protein